MGTVMGAEPRERRRFRLQQLDEPQTGREA